METKFIFAWMLLLCTVVSPPIVTCKFYSTSIPHRLPVLKKTNLHFFLHDIISGNNPTAILVAYSNRTGLIPTPTNPTPYGSIYVFDDPLTEGPDPNSKVIGRARGIYVSDSQGKDLTLLISADFAFTEGKFNGSSISIHSRNPVTETRREMALAGGRGKFRMATGFALLKTQFLNFTNGDAIIEYYVTVYHY